MAPSKSNKRRRQAARQQASRQPARSNETNASASRSNETNVAEGTTVAWMLAAMGAGCTELVAFLSMAALAYRPIARQLPEKVQVLPWLMLLVALVTGSIALLLTPMVFKQRNTPPPASVVNFAIFVGVLAWVMFLGSLWF